MAKLVEHPIYEQQPKNESTVPVEVSRARGGKGEAKTVFVGHPPAVFIEELSSEQQTEILQDWLETVRSARLKNAVKENYAAGEMEVVLDYDISAIFTWWQSNAASARLTKQQISEWFETSIFAAYLIDQRKLQAKVVEQILTALLNLAAPTPKITATEAAALLKVFEASEDRSILADVLQRKLTKLANAVASDLLSVLS